MTRRGESFVDCDLEKKQSHAQHCIVSLDHTGTSTSTGISVLQNVTEYTFVEWRDGKLTKIVVTVLHIWDHYYW
jgi:hypothetical protein